MYKRPLHFRPEWYLLLVWYSGIAYTTLGRNCININVETVPLFPARVVLTDST